MDDISQGQCLPTPKLILVDRQPQVVQAWRTEFQDLEQQGLVKTALDVFQSHSADMIVSPANSFGFMDGGIDYHYSLLFGWDLQDRVQHSIRSGHQGELLVGQAFSLVTQHKQFPWIIIAPTMRLPMKIMDPADVFLATRAALREAKFFQSRNPERQISVLFPGMGTGAGALDAELCALHMRKAYDAVFVGETFPTSWEQGLRTTYGAR
jgi:O-acetyl-ADP-ribose deacetylase (regulator of RNase III)